MSFYPKNYKILGIVVILSFSILLGIYLYYWYNHLRCDYNSFEECVNNSDCGEGFGSDLDVTKCDCSKCYQCSVFKSENNKIFAKSICPTFIKTPLTDPVDLDAMSGEAKNKLSDSISSSKDTLGVKGIK